MMKRVLGVLVIAVYAGVLGCRANEGGSTAGSGDGLATPGVASTAAGSMAGMSGGIVTLPSGLKYEDLTVGEGPVAENGMKATVNYTGWLLDGTKFDSSFDSGNPYPFQLGSGSVIRGWDEGVKGMKVGGKRKLTIPPQLGYGAAGYGGVIPPNATLVFEVELLEVQ